MEWMIVVVCCCRQLLRLFGKLGRRSSAGPERSFLLRCVMAWCVSESETSTTTTKKNDVSLGISGLNSVVNEKESNLKQLE